MTSSEVNCAGTGLIMIVLGAIAILPVYLSSRSRRTPFVQKDIIGGYNGIAGIGAVTVGVVLLIVSILLVVFG